MSQRIERELAALRAENARLIALLETHGVDWKPPPVATPIAASTMLVDEKLALFRRLFAGRTDAYALRWENKSGKSGYAPACANEWRAGVCEKPRVKCSDCLHRSLLPLTDQVVAEHLRGRITAGVYPLLSDDTCRFLAVDFDEADWREDAAAFVHTCRELEVPTALEISRSGNGAHVWLFFAHAVPAQRARQLGAALVSRTCARRRQLRLESYDRFFPNQDTMPKGGFGNLIALPLQKQPREEGRSVFVDIELRPHADQWAFLASIVPLSNDALEAIIGRATNGSNPLDVAFVVDEDVQEPWRRSADVPAMLAGPMPAKLTLTVANQIFIAKDGIPQALANRLIRLAAFQNPEFYKAQALRLSVWDKPRVIGRAENFPQHFALPRGCLEAAMTLLREQGIDIELRDERTCGEPLSSRFTGKLRPDQDVAVAAMLEHDIGVLQAPTAFGKTVTAAALIARRAVNTLILVHRTELMMQWKERLHAFLDLDPKAVGLVGGGKRKPGSKIDIAVIQSLVRKGKVDTLVENYGHIIVDECHHVSTASFEAVLRRARAKHVLGLTATPIRRDGLAPIIFMQCGAIRHAARIPDSASLELTVLPQRLAAHVEIAGSTGIQSVFQHLANDPARTSRIVETIAAAFKQGRKVLALTERADHLVALHAALAQHGIAPFALHGRMGKKERAACLANLNALPADAPRVLLATGKLVGEGFDHPPLDTLILAMPISWKGTLQQYAGRLHRSHESKREVRIVDFIDTSHPALLRMWQKRERGYRAIGYRIVVDEEPG